MKANRLINISNVVTITIIIHTQKSDGADTCCLVLVLVVVVGAAGDALVSVSVKVPTGLGSLMVGEIT